MKHIFLIMMIFLSMRICSAGDMSNSIEYDHLYIVGDATPTSWNLGAAPEMAQTNHGVFEWIGTLESGKDFKFMNSRDGWHKHVVGTMEAQLAEVGQIYNLNFYADWALDGTKDCKFHVATTGEYHVVVDLTAMRMQLSIPEKTLERPEKLYLYGSAVSDGGADTPLVGGVEFKGVYHLREGEVKLMDTPFPGPSTTYYVPKLKDVDISFGDGYAATLESSADSCAMGWSVSIPGDYAIYVDAGTMSYSAKSYKPYPVLYLVGGCCEHAWNYWDASVCCLYPDESNPDIMVWEGELRIGWDNQGGTSTPDEPSKFKILTAQDWFGATFHPYKADAAAEGSSDARISGGDDLKWTISRDGFYRIELDTRREVLTGTYYGESGVETVEPVPDAQVDHEAEEYYDLRGIRLKNPGFGLCIRRTANCAEKVWVR